MPGLLVLITWVVNAVALLALPYLLDSIWVDNFYAALITAAVLGLVNAVIRPIFILLTLPATLLSMGLFIFIINGLMLWGVSYVVSGFHVAGFWAAVGGALLVNVISNSLIAILTNTFNIKIHVKK